MSGAVNESNNERVKLILSEIAATDNLEVVKSAEECMRKISIDIMKKNPEIVSDIFKRLYEMRKRLEKKGVANV